MTSVDLDLPVPGTVDLSTCAKAFLQVSFTLVPILQFLGQGIPWQHIDIIYEVESKPTRSRDDFISFNPLS